MFYLLKIYKQYLLHMSGDFIIINDTIIKVQILYYK